MFTGIIQAIGKLSASHQEGSGLRLCIEGVNSIGEAGIELQLIPHTLRETTLGGYQVGSRVNIEVDIIARYLERLLPGAGSPLFGRGAGE